MPPRRRNVQRNCTCNDCPVHIERRPPIVNIPERLKDSEWTRVAEKCFVDMLFGYAQTNDIHTIESMDAFFQIVQPILNQRENIVIQVVVERNPHQAEPVHVFHFGVYTVEKLRTKLNKLHQLHNEFQSFIAGPRYRHNRETNEVILNDMRNVHPLQETPLQTFWLEHGYEQAAQLDYIFNTKGAPFFPNHMLVAQQPIEVSSSDDSSVDIEVLDGFDTDDSSVGIEVLDGFDTDDGSTVM